MKINKIILTILILSIVTLVFSGCGGGNPVIPSPPDESTEPIVPETTKIVEEETIQEIVSVTEDQSTIVFEKSTPQLEELAPGDIIAMGVTENTPEGLLRKVKNITKGAKDSSEVMVETEFVTLEEAVEQGEFDFDISLQAKNMKQSFSGIEGVKLITDKSKLKDSSHEFNYEINLIAYDGDGNPNTLEDNMVLIGNISFDYNIIFAGKIESHELKNFILKSVVEIETGITISGGGSLTVNIAGKSFLPKPINLGTYTVWLGPVPVILSPSIDLKWDLNGGIYGTVTTGVTRTETFTAGLEWNNGITQPIADYNTSYDYIPPSTSKGGIIKFSIGPELMCKIYKVAGPYCNTGPYIKLIADISADPWWELRGGLAVLTGVKLEILKKTYLNVYLTVIDVSGTIAQADGPFGGTNHAPVISNLTANPSSININETTAITCTASDEDVGDTLTYTWTKNGGTFEGSTSGSTITWSAPSTKGNYTVTCEVSDGEASDNEQVIISVGDVNHPPVITSIAVTSATKGQPYSYDVNATDADGDTPVYSLISKPSGMTINSSTGLITWTPTATGSFGVTVKAYDGELFDTQSFTIIVEEISTAILPNPPTSLSPGTTSAPGPIISTLTPTLQWQAVSNADYYNLSVSIYPYGTSNIIYYNQQVYGNSITVPSGELEAGKKYRWNMRAYNSAGYSDYSLDYYFQTGTTTTLPPTLTLVGSGGVSPGSGTPSTTFTYSVYYSDPEGASPTVKNVYIDGSSHTMSGSGSGSTYTYQISGLSAGTHTYSFQFSDGTTTVNLPTSGTYAAPTVTSTLVPPTGFSVSSYWNTASPGFPSMSLSWNAVSGATGYEMWVRPSGGSYASLGTRDAPYVTFNSNSLPGGARYVSGTTYYFKVRTVTASGTSDFTSEVSCVAAASPTTSIGQVQLSSPGNGFTLPPMNITFIWNFVSNATKYEIIIYNPLGQVALDQTTTNIHIIVALGTEETITWKVRAGDDSGNWGAWSSTWSLTIKTFT